MRTFVALLLLSIAVSEVVGQAQFQVNTGSGCVSASVGDCVSCTSGDIKSVSLRKFQKGELQYAQCTDTNCLTISEYQYRTATVCDGLPLCTAAPSTFNAFHVSSSLPINMMVLGDDDDSYGAAFLNITNAVAAGTLPRFVFRTDAGHVRFVEQYDDGSYLTNLGLCQIGAHCSLGGFSIVMETIPLADIAQLSRPLAHLATALLGEVAPDMVSVYLGYSYAVSTTNENAFIFNSDGFTVSQSALETVVGSVPPHVTVSDMQLKNVDQPRPSLISKIAFSDFETYADTECFQESGLSFSLPGFSSVFGDSDANVVECEFSFSFSFDISNFFSNFFFSFSFDDEVELEALPTFEEAPAFALFE